MKYYSFTDEPIQICGLDHIDPVNGQYWRMHDEDSAKVSEAVQGRSKTAGGARVRFRTNAPSVKIKISLHTLGVDLCIPLPGSSGLDVYTGTGIGAKYRGYVSPTNYTEKTQEKEIWLHPEFVQKDMNSEYIGEKMSDVVLNLPRNERLAGVEIGIPDGYTIEAPLPFTSAERIIYYGSSITEGGCASRPGNAYTAMVARWLDCDYQNLGFSGVARGEEAMAKHIAAQDCTIFVLDSAPTAPDARHLEATHEPFYKIIREARPNLHIIMMSKPDYDADPAGNAKRRDVIYRTYVNARMAGDENVYFIDGASFFGVLGRDSCTIDNCHPNDLGFFRMAEQVYRVIGEILSKK